MLAAVCLPYIQQGCDYLNWYATLVLYIVTYMKKSKRISYMEESEKLDKLGQGKAIAALGILLIGGFGIKNA